MRIVVCRLDEFPPGERRIVQAGRRSIGVFRVGDRFYAINNYCPHQGGPLCLGRTKPWVSSSGPGEFVLAEDDALLACPWHGWEYDLATGQSFLGPGEPPPFPALDCFTAPENHVFAFKGLWECNWLQAMEVGIDLGELIRSYAKDVNDFQEWLERTLELAAGDQIADYRRCTKRIKAVSSRCYWNIIFQQVVLPAKRDPYQYLDQYLTPDELKDVNALPLRSKEQVDRIISLVDEYNACDSELRALVYKAFGVK
jgi:nitrite reductase/ring-hydroxylating ferredoxin subunit